MSVSFVNIELTHGFTNRLTKRLTGWLLCWLAGSLACWLAGLPTDRLMRFTPKHLKNTNFKPTI
jgi:hypothetical protein